MTYLLTLHRHPLLTLATTEPVVPPEQFAQLQDAVALAEELSTLLAGQQAAVAQAQAEGYAAGEAAGYTAGQARAQQDAAAALAVEPGGADFLDLFDGGPGDGRRGIFTGS